MAARTRRAVAAAVIPVAVVLAVLLAFAGPAAATFAVTEALPSMTVSTETVAPPTDVTAVVGSCSNGRWRSITVSWNPSASRGVSGYRVDAHRDDGSTVTVEETSATSTTTTLDKLSPGSTTVTFTVRTLTTYGWTAESAPTGSLTC